MKRLFAILLALALPLGGLATAEADPEPAIVDIVPETVVEAATEAPAAEVNDAAIGGADEPGAAPADANGAGVVVTVRNKGKVSLYVGDRVKLAVKGKKIRKCVSKNKGVATVTKKGALTAKAAGRAKIVITLGNNKKVTVNVTVRALPDAVELSDCIGRDMSDVLAALGETSGYKYEDEGVGIFMYEGDGVDFVILEEPPESRYYRKVNQIRVATDRYALFGMVRGEAAADARRKAEGRGFVYDAAESTDARLQLYRNSEENGAYYYEELTAYCQNGRATEYNYMAYRVDSPYVPDASPTPDQPA